MARFLLVVILNPRMKTVADRSATRAFAEEEELPPSRPGLYGSYPLEGVAAPLSVLAGKYRIERILGTGGMAVVAAAYHLQLHQRVAIKYLVEEALEYPEVVERFTREARAAARIRGEHVARVIDVGTFDCGAPYMVLEYLRGQDLAWHLTKNGPLPVGDVVRYMLETCEALAEAHTAQIVHRDLKPANLFLAKGPDHRNMIKVLDFGVSKIVDEPMTDPAKLLGTVGYMSPEQLRASHGVDTRTDIWSIGVIMYELLTGVTPFTGATMVAIAQAITTNTPKPISEIRPDLPAGLAAAITRCMSTHPADRFPTVLELARAIAPFAEGGDPKSVARIMGVVCGSMAPPPIAIPAYAATPLPATPKTPPPIASEAPMVTPIRATPELSRSIASTWLRSGRTWFAVGALAIAALVSGRDVLQRAPAAKPPPVPSAITVHLSSTAASAQARIDDGPLVALPLEKQVPRDDRDHTIYMEAQGYLPRTKTVKFGSDVYIGLSLSPRPGD
jgi:serine/threonine-protein kinase